MIHQKLHIPRNKLYDKIKSILGQKDALEYQIPILKTFPVTITNFVYKQLLHTNYYQGIELITNVSNSFSHIPQIKENMENLLINYHQTPEYKC